MAKNCAHKTKVKREETIPTKVGRNQFDNVVYEITECKACGKKLRSCVKPEEPETEVE